MSSAAKRRRILVVAGEASGDRHAAGLVAEALRLDPALSFAGVGGEHLRACGAEIHHDARDLAVVGITEVLGRGGRLLSALRDMRRRLREERPDGLLLIDFPDFNLHLAGVAARLGVPVVYFVSPQVWAWRAGRVRTIRRCVRRMIVLFSFEEEFYRRHGVDVVLAGHPLVDQAGPTEDRAVARRRLGLDPDGLVFGLAPGSRAAEVSRLLDPLLETGRVLVERAPGARLLIPVAGTVDSGAIAEAAARSGLPVVALSGAFERIVAACDAAIAASGTVTLELALRDVPTVVVYRTSALSYWVARLAVKVPFISLVNLIAGREILPELVQGDFTPAHAAEHALALATPGPVRDQALAALADIRRRLGPPGAYARAARAFVEALDEVGSRRGQSSP